MIVKVPSSICSPPTLFARLKAATAAQHAELEARLNPLESFRDRTAYAAYLARVHPLYRVVESELSKHDWSGIGIDFEERRKLGLIESDLAFLNEKAVTAMPAIPCLYDLANSIGVLYVLEGATLGGQMISRHLKQLGLEPGRGASFFNGYGPRTGEMWKAFQTAATRGVHNEAETESAVDGARNMFNLFGQWMGQ